MSMYRNAAFLMSFMAAGCSQSVDPASEELGGEEDSVPLNTEDPPADDDPQVDEGTPWVALELVMGPSIASGAQRVVETDTAASGTCSAGVHLGEAGWAGIAITPAFLDRAVGTATTIDPADLAGWVPLQWSDSDPEADATVMTDEWVGTMVIAEWSVDRIVIDLIDGLHCDLPNHDNCVEESGTLSYVGARAPAVTWTESTGSGFVDVATGAAICAGIQ